MGYGCGVAWMSASRCASLTQVTLVTLILHSLMFRQQADFLCEVSFYSESAALFRGLSGSRSCASASSACLQLSVDQAVTSSWLLVACAESDESALQGGSATEAQQHPATGKLESLQRLCYDLLAESRGLQPQQGLLQTLGQHQQLMGLAQAKALQLCPGCGPAILSAPQLLPPPAYALELQLQPT